MKIFFVTCFVFLCSASFAQQHATPFTQCQLNIDEIILEQSFGIDEPISEDARSIFYEMYEELNFIYKIDSTDPKLTQHVNIFKEALQKAADLNLNVSMFQKDIDYVYKISQ